MFFLHSYRLHTVHYLLFAYSQNRKFRLKWPWEQDRQMAVYNRTSELIQVASQPHRAHMQVRAGFVDGWCLSHLPGSGCFISHYCANAHSKQVMKELYSLKVVVEEGKADADHLRTDFSVTGDGSGVNVQYLSF